MVNGGNKQKFETFLSALEINHEYQKSLARKTGSFEPGLSSRLLQTVSRFMSDETRGRSDL
jgi:hypothetical protein